jgi:hypothetical protein
MPGGGGIEVTEKLVVFRTDRADGTFRGNFHHVLLEHWRR